MKAKALKKSSSSWLIEVGLVSHSPFETELSYFSSQKLKVGQLVKVPIRSKLVLGVVLSARAVRQAKSLIKTSRFSMKKIHPTDILSGQLSPATYTALEKTALYYGTRIGTLLASLWPKTISDHAHELLCQKKPKKKSQAHLEKILLQMENEERYSQYRALIRQSFAQGQSVMLVIPTHLEIARVYDQVSRGISEYAHTFTLQGSKKATLEVWRKAQEEKHPILFITTPAGSLFTREDLGMIIVERLSSRAYRSFSRPFLDHRRFIETLAEAENYQLILGDSVLPLETLWREKNGEYGEASLIRWRLPTTRAELVEMKGRENESGQFEIFSNELKALIQEAVSNRSSLFLFGVRKGLAPTTICGDCGTLLPCLNCGAPVVLHEKGQEKIYLCHACGGQRSSLTTCGNCQSWKLVPLGIGTQEIARQVKKLHPEKNVFILDKDHATSEAKAREIVEKCKAQQGILVGTELAFFYLDSIAYSGLVSVDSLFSIPDFGMSERIFYLVNRLREITTTRTLIQTRNIGQQILTWGAQGNITDFYQDEIAGRETLLYPPFSIFIKISLLPNKKVPVREELDLLEQKFSRWKPETFHHSLILRIPRNEYPDRELSRELTLLPPHFSIKVDPESIL